MKKVDLQPECALNMRAIDGSCLKSETDEQAFVLVFEGIYKRIVGIEMTKSMLFKLKENIDLYFTDRREGTESK